MKKTGMVRKLDELGRIVIPKEIRNVLKLKVGMQLEIYINENGELVLKEFYPVAALKNLAEDFCDILSTLLNKDIFVCDRKEIVAASGENKKKLLHKELSQEIMALIYEKKNYLGNTQDNTTLIKVVDSLEGIKSELFFPLMLYGECEGMIGLLDFEDKGIVEHEIRSLELASKFIQRQLEND